MYLLSPPLTPFADDAYHASKNIYIAARSYKIRSGRGRAPPFIWMEN
jgi:hypothetical protein